MSVVEYIASDCFFFFFSSRRRHTRFKCDWSSDVCSSDLANSPDLPGDFTSDRLGGDRFDQTERPRLLRNGKSDRNLRAPALFPPIERQTFTIYCTTRPLCRVALPHQPSANPANTLPHTPTAA